MIITWLCEHIHLIKHWSLLWSDSLFHFCSCTRQVKTNEFVLKHNGMILSAGHVVTCHVSPLRGRGRGTPGTRTGNCCGSCEGSQTEIMTNMRYNKYLIWWVLVVVLILSLDGTCVKKQFVFYDMLIWGCCLITVIYHLQVILVNQENVTRTFSPLH